MVETIEWTAGGVVMIDQTRLPLHEEYVTCRNYQEVAVAIRDMIIRGAPAIGVAAAMGVAIGVQHASEADLDGQVDTICDTLARTRPTAVNLFWAIDRMKRLYTTLRGQPIAQIRERLIQEAQLVREEDIAINRAIGRHGAPLVPDHKTVLTHCNAGALATAGYGTALGVIRAARESGKQIDVYRRRDPPVSAGRAPHRLGTAAGRHSRHPDHRQHGRPLHEVGTHRLRGRRRGPHRRQRRRRQQDRHLLGGRARQGKRRAVLRRRAQSPRSTSPWPPAIRSPSNSAPPPK